MMPLTYSTKGQEMRIMTIREKNETVRFLESLGFTNGEPVMVVSENGGNMIVRIRNSRVAISRELAMKIMVS